MTPTVAQRTSSLSPMQRRLLALLLTLVAFIALGLAQAGRALALTQDGLYLTGYRNCYFDSNHWTHVQVLRAQYSSGYYHNLYEAWMGNQTFDSNGNKLGNSEPIVTMQAVQQNSTGSVNFGPGQVWTFGSGGAYGYQSPVQSQSAFHLVHGSGLYVWWYLKRADGKSCTVKYAIT